MMKNSLYFFLLHLFALFLYLQFPCALTLPENRFGDCLPTSCGDVNITYPFYTDRNQNSYCGYPGFEVSCRNNKLAYFNIFGASYVIRNISYDEQTFKVVNSLILESHGEERSCPGSFQNLTLNNGLFNYAANYSDIFLLQNCSESVLFDKTFQSSVICGVVAVYGNDSKLQNLMGKCSELISVPYDVKKENVSDVRETLQQGFSLKWTANKCSTCIDSGGQCGYDQTVSEFNCFCPDRTHSYYCATNLAFVKTRATRKLVIIISGLTTTMPMSFGVSDRNSELGSAALATLMVVALIICIKRRHSGKTFWILGSRGIKDKKNNVEAFLKSYGSLAPKRYKYTDIKKMTGTFKDKLGEGGFGVVYKGRLHDGQFVAVKKLNKMKGNGEDFINEVVSISTTNHVNVVALKGFCIDGRKRALVYEFLPNGSLEKFVYGAGNRQTLQFETLFKIAIGIARGLDYLHRGCNTRILHFDIKPHNILLDEEFCPKISDFGLAKLCPTKDNTVSMLEARGTIGFIAPEVFCRNFGGVSHKSDVYSYGMMVLDMACGRENVYAEVHRSSEMYFPEWIYNRLEDGEEVGAHAVFNEDEKVLRQKMILVSLWCIQTYPSNRPPMNKVLEMLEGPLESLQLPPKPHLSSPPVSLIDFSAIASSTT